MLQISFATIGTARTRRARSAAGSETNAALTTVQADIFPDRTAITFGAKIGGVMILTATLAVPRLHGAHPMSHHLDMSRRVRQEKLSA